MTAPNAPVEPVFVADPPAPLTRPVPSGLLLLAERPAVPSGHLRWRGLGDGGGWLLGHLPSTAYGGRPPAGWNETALRQKGLGPVVAAALHAGGHAAPAWTALLLSAHLNGHRTPWMGRRLWTTSVERPSVCPPGMAAIWHLVATRTLSGAGLVDRVVWEVMPDELIERWLGAPWPTQRHRLDDRLLRLLELRRLLRAGALPDRAPFTALRKALNGGYLSARFAHRNLELVVAAADALPEPAVHTERRAS
ncbi:hypothetical protein [Thermomonospora umbrina]|uniref:Uncharacterized protein n=1 Tax=Thermomonospora umbrina TaxID=111806 RepID=A0A3D9T2Z6_9ACTN|nr:hypothetical protein [Thermomonospora umbrina]REF00744.1 hypothetical protein DFJ69_6323 [Thermomonospora umbrina]